MGAISQKTKDALALRRETDRKAFVATWRHDPDGTVRIPLSMGFEAVLDACDFDLASEFTWRLRIHSSRGVKKTYAEAKVPKKMRDFCKDGTESTSLHRVLMGFPECLQIDHEDGNGLNCRRRNMRVATGSQNASNRRYENKTGYRGVVKIGNRYAAQLDHLGVHYNLGRRGTPEEAAVLYNKEAISRFGEFAILNEVSQ